MSIALPTLTVLAVFLAGCATTGQSTYIKDGREYGITRGTFRDKWWNYYERGSSFAEGGFHNEAIDDYKAAIIKRKDDQWRARTYGMHFVDYFPHRELGIVYYRQQRYEEAITELEASLGAAESSKAKYFLNKARRATLEKHGADAEPPLLKIAEVPTATREQTLSLSGVAEDDLYVSSVAVNDTPVFLELSAKIFPFEAVVELKRGMNEIRVVAEDLTGKKAERVFEVFSDRQGPLITVSDRRDAGGRVKISGFVSDETAVERLTADGKEIISGPLKESVFEHDAISDGGVIILEAKDAVGNLTRAEVPIAGDMTASRWPLLASAGGLFALGIGDFVDRASPVIRLKGMDDVQEVYDTDILIEGEAADESNIVSLKVNGEEILRKEGKRAYFSHLSALKKGDNKFAIEAVDSHNNKASKSVLVKRNSQEARDISSRMLLALLPVERKGERSSAGDALYDSLIAAFFNQGRFKVVERAKMEAVLRELKLSQTNLVDPETAAKAGKIAAADGIISATVVETKDSIEVIARLIDTETAVIMSANDAFDEQKGLMAVKKLTDALAYKFRRDLPLLEGVVIEAKGGEVLIDIGKGKKIKENMKLILFREGPKVKHPLTGKLLGSKTEELGRARVKDVFEEFSSASVTGKGKSTINVMDKVITK